MSDNKPEPGDEAKVVKVEPPDSRARLPESGVSAAESEVTPPEAEEEPIGEVAVDQPVEAAPTVLEDDRERAVVPPDIRPITEIGVTRRRLAGLLAIVLGVAGVALSLVAAATSIRFGFTAGDTAQRLVEPIDAAVTRLDTRIDETDDLVDADGIPLEDLDALGARIDGLADLTNLADQGFATIDDHPIYGWLPVQLDDLGDQIDQFKESAATVASGLASASVDGIPATAASSMAENLNGMQARISGTRDLIDESESSLQRWIRLGALLGFVVSLVSLWGQVSLVKRGWRGLRGRLP